MRTLACLHAAHPVSSKPARSDLRDDRDPKISLAQLTPISAPVERQWESAPESGEWLRWRKRMKTAQLLAIYRLSRWRRAFISARVDRNRIRRLRRQGLR